MMPLSAPPKRKSTLSDSIIKTKKKLANAKKWLYKLGGKSIGGINSQVTSIGKSAINSIFKALEKNQR